VQLASHQSATQQALSEIERRLELATAPSGGGFGHSFPRTMSSSSIRSMSPIDALSSSPPRQVTAPKLPSANGNSSLSSTSVTPLTLHKTAGESGSISALSLPSAEKKDDSITSHHRVSFDHQARGNWGNRIVLTTYPGQANVGTLRLMSSLK
jgi:hypothetical protein